jgi:hypothetical protein
MHCFSICLRALGFNDALGGRARELLGVAKRFGYDAFWQSQEASASRRPRGRFSAVIDSVASPIREGTEATSS